MSDTETNATSPPNAQDGPLTTKWLAYLGTLGHSPECTCPSVQLARFAFYAGALAAVQGLFDPEGEAVPFLQRVVEDLRAFDRDIHLEGLMKRASQMPYSRNPS